MNVAFLDTGEVACGVLYHFTHPSSLQRLSVLFLVGLVGRKSE